MNSFVEFDELYGGLWSQSPLTYAVRHYFLNGGHEALICRLPEDRLPDNGHIADPALEAQHRGLWLLESATLFNILCIPPIRSDLDVSRATWDAAATYARRRRAMLLVDPPASWTDPAQVTSGLGSLISPHENLANAALYFPRIRAVDPLRNDAEADWAPSGAVAGIIARTDAERGVWKAPAGLDAALTGVAGLAVDLTDADTGRLNPLGVNVLRSFPRAGSVIWGGRTMRGADALASEWKYVPVRRLALFIEESLFRGADWAVFEPNGTGLWDRLRAATEVFLHDLFRRGAFQGRTPREAYYVRCDASTTTAGDIANGIVNVEVGFAPLRPAEFVILRVGIAAARP